MPSRQRQYYKALRSIMDEWSNEEPKDPWKRLLKVYKITSQSLHD